MKLSTVTFASFLYAVSANSILPDNKKSAPACSMESRFASSSYATSTTTTSFSKVPSSLGAALSLRGGEVLEPTTLSEVDDILIKASAEGKLVVIDFSATWCGPCKAIAPLYKELSEQNPHIVFVKVDVDDNQETAAKYEVTAMPTFLFIKRGEIVDKMMGANPTKLQELLQELA